MITVIVRIATSSEQSKLYEELDIDNPEARTVMMRIRKDAVKMWCEAEDGGTDLWMIGDEISTPLDISVKDFDKKMQ